MKPITTHYLHMCSPEAHRGLPDQPSSTEPPLTLMEAELDEFRFNRFLYQYIGEAWQWQDKLSQSDEQWRAYVHRPELRTFVAYDRGSIAGYFELDAKSSEPDPWQGVTEGCSVQIAYFGLAQAFLGKGLGGYLLSQAITQAWQYPNTSRVWVHTCSLDHANALPNYLARGFSEYHRSTD